MAIKEAIWAGHSAVILKSNDSVIAIDPWLEGNPSVPSDIKNIQKLDLIVLSHGHFDHAGDAARLARSLGAKVAATFELASLIQQEGVPESQIISMNKGGTAEASGVSITLTNAFHSSSYETARGPVYAGEPCGVVIKDGKNSIYHSGDTALFSDMRLIGEIHRPTLAFICAGDRFTMGPKEAALAAKYIGAEINVPIHHSTFDLLTGSPADFERECRALGLEASVLKPGQSLRL